MLKYLKYSLALHGLLLAAIIGMAWWQPKPEVKRLSFMVLPKGDTLESGGPGSTPPGLELPSLSDPAANVPPGEPETPPEQTPEPTPAPTPEATPEPTPAKTPRLTPLPSRETPKPDPTPEKTPEPEETPEPTKTPKPTPDKDDEDKKKKAEAAKKKAEEKRDKERAEEKAKEAEKEKAAEKAKKAKAEKEEKERKEAKEREEAKQRKEAEERKEAAAKEEARKKEIASAYDAKKNDSGEGDGEGGTKKGKTGVPDGVEGAPLPLDRPEGTLSSIYTDRAIMLLTRNFIVPRGINDPDLVCVVEWEITTAGNVRNIRVVKSTGNTDLDSAAVNAVKNAGNLGRLPADFGGKSLWVSLPFIYGQ